MTRREPMTDFGTIPEPLATARRPAPRRRSRRLARFIAPRRQRRVGRGYSRLVRLMKVALPLAAVALLVVIVLWPRLRDAMQAEAPQPALEADGPMQMISPRLASRDANNQPFVVQATSVTQSEEDADAMLLDGPRAELTLKDGRQVTLAADNGRYDQREGALILEGGVTVERDDGTVFSTDRAFVDVRAGSAWGSAPVMGRGPFGRLEAAGFRISDRGGSVVFLGPSRMTLEQGEELPG